MSEYKIAREGLTSLAKTYEQHIELVDKLPFDNPELFISEHTDNVAGIRKSVKEEDDIFGKCQDT